MRLAVLILAAGKGTRMVSRLAKVLHPLAGRPMIDYSVTLAERLSPQRPLVVVGHGADQVRAALGERCRYVEQTQQLGTGHAVMQAQVLLQDEADVVLVYTADMPLLTVETLRRVVSTHGQQDAPITMLTFVADDPRGFGRIVRGANGEVLGIVEEPEATPEQLDIRELNASVYCFTAAWLWGALPRLQPSPGKGEYYLTDSVGLAVADGHKVMAVSTTDATEVMGINNRLHLAEAETLLRRRRNRDLMLSGVTLIDPETTYVQPDVEIGADTVLWPGVCVRGRSHIGAGCEIGPGAVLTNVWLEDGCRVGSGAVLEEVIAGPTTYFPAGTVTVRPPRFLE